MHAVMSNLLQCACSWSGPSYHRLLLLMLVRLRTRLRVMLPLLTSLKLKECSVKAETPCCLVSSFISLLATHLRHAAATGDADEHGRCDRPIVNSHGIQCDDSQTTNQRIRPRAQCQLNTKAQSGGGVEYLNPRANVYTYEFCSCPI